MEFMHRTAPEKIKSALNASKRISEQQKQLHQARPVPTPKSLRSSPPQDFAADSADTAHSIR